MTHFFLMYSHMGACVCTCVRAHRPYTVRTYIRTYKYMHMFVVQQVSKCNSIGRSDHGAINMWKLKYTLKKIKARLEGEIVSKTSLCLLIKKYKTTGSEADYRPTARPKKLKDIHYRFINKQTAKDDELTGIKLLGMLKEESSDVSVSLSTVKRVKHELGCVVKKTRYCALILENNQEEVSAVVSKAK